MPPAPSSRRRLRVALVLLLLLGMAGGTAYVFHLAGARTDPFAQALELRRAGDDAGAEARLRSILSARPRDDRARGLLVEILTEDGRVDEAEALARPWLDAPATEALGLRALCQIALARLDLGEALRLARTVADRDPAFAQATIMHVQDALGTPASLAQSAQAAETLATLAEAPEVQAQAWLYAAETLATLWRRTPVGTRREALARRVALDRTKARDALRESRLWKERYPEATSLMARIELLSDDEQERSAAAARLGVHLDRAPDDHAARTSLLRYLVASGRAAEAVAEVRALLGAPALAFVRALALLASGGERRAALALLDEKARAPQGILALVRARLLVEGDEAERERGVQELERLALARPDDLALVRECHRRILAAGRPERAAALLEQAGVTDPEARFDALLDTALVEVAAGSPAAEGLLLRLADEVDPSRLTGTFLRLWRAGARGEGAALSFLGRVLGNARLPAADARVLRAMLLLRPVPDDPREARERREQAVEDLRALAEDPATTRLGLTNGASLAVVAGQPRLLGRLLGRALLTPGERGAAEPQYVQVLGVGEEGQREEAAAGMREAAASSTAFGPWLLRLADALAAGDRDALRRPAAGWSPSPEAPQPGEGELQVLLAERAGDLAEAEAYARALLAAWPERAGARERLGEVLLEARRFQAVLDLPREDPPPVRERLQRIAALEGLGRSAEAIAEARALVRETRGGDEALLALGRLLRTVDPAGALATLSPLTAQPPAQQLRALLLEERGDEASAAQVYEDLVISSGYRDLAAWGQLGRLRSAQGRQPDFIRLASAVIESPPPGMSAVEVALLRLFRGMSRENMQDYERALEDYEAVMGVLPGHPGALNNAAWVMARHIAWRAEARPAKLAEALELSSRAVKAAPEAAAVRHTRAKILEALDRREEALEDLRAALRLVEAGIARPVETLLEREEQERERGRRGRYQLEEGALLEALGRVAEARAVYAALRDDRPRTPEGRRAVAALERLGE